MKFWPKSFHKSSVIFDIFHKTHCAWFSTFSYDKLGYVFILGHTRSTEYKIQLHTILKLLQLNIHLSNCETWIILPPNLQNILNCSFRIKENLHWKLWEIQIVLSKLWKISYSTFILWKISAFLPQNSFKHAEALVAYFPLSTLCMEFFIQLTLHIVEHKLFYFPFCWKF